MSVIHALLLVEERSSQEALAVKGLLRCGVPCEVEVIRHDGQSIADLLAPEGASPSLILLELSDPETNAIPLLRELRSNKRTRGVPIVILSLEQPEGSIRKCLAEGADHVVSKPSEPAAFVEHVSLIARSWLAADKVPDNSTGNHKPSHW